MCVYILQLPYADRKGKATHSNRGKQVQSPFRSTLVRIRSTGWCSAAIWLAMQVQPPGLPKGSEGLS